MTLFLVTDSEGQTTALFRNARSAVDYDGDATYIYAVEDREGGIEPVQAFYEVTMDLATGETHTEMVDRYCHGSESGPCRHYATLGGQLVTQELTTIVAWGVTEQEAIERLREHAHEGRKRAARDSYIERRRSEFRKANPKHGHDIFDTWTYAPGVDRDALYAEAQRIYDETA